MNNKRGETLVETITSLVLFIVILSSVTIMIQLAWKFINETTDMYSNIDNDIVNAENKQNLTEEKEMVFSFSIEEEDIFVNIPISVKKSGRLRIYETK